ncbi:hypothetical protein [Paraburkholderia phenazinium]|jgi:hypothetical protein|uniref:Uncharacterized protein n=1 Tax=Paraburkholderia phenazinium TaxID=60549 RepID=A0A1G8GQM2_9BURK|nr:hypothetical protein [Paraburkholderia phenazinium]SDH96600.1 hypothetical protein SAMN05216466_115102 [Paraburkholderia phenazinium]
MKSLFAVTLAGVGLLLATALANGQDVQTNTQPRGRAILEQNADESAQDATDMSYTEPGQAGNLPARAISNVSYGGTVDFTGESGGPRCAPGSQCNIFRGR